MYSSDRVPTFLVPVLQDGLRHGRPVDACLTVVAAWARWLEVTADRVDNRDLPVGEALLDRTDLVGDLEPVVRLRLEELLAQLRTDPRSVLPA